MTTKGFKERIADGEKILIAEGILLEFIRRGRVKAGSFIPEVVLDGPEHVAALHQEFVDAGSDVVQAFTYFAHRSKMRDFGREHELESINKQALKIAKEVARKNNKLFAGGLCNSSLWDPEDPSSIEETAKMFREQATWAKEAEVDYMIAETFSDYGEASLALKVLKEFGFATEITVSCKTRGEAVTFDGVPITECLRRLEEEGADVVGLNCGYGIRTMIPLIRDVRAVCKGPIACKPVCYRTTEEKPNYQRLTCVDNPEQSCYPHDLQQHLVSRDDVEWFAQQCLEIGVTSIGLCCGNDPAFFSLLSRTVGRDNALSKYKPDREKNVLIASPRSRYVRLGAFSGVVKH